MIQSAFIICANRHNSGDYQKKSGIVNSHMKFALKKCTFLKCVLINCIFLKYILMTYFPKAFIFYLIGTDIFFHVTNFRWNAKEHCIGILADFRLNSCCTPKLGLSVLLYTITEFIYFNLNSIRSRLIWMTALGMVLYLQ
jgi:hypothetical protein